MICAIHQPQFLPWLGYLQKIHASDVFVILDTVQFKKNEYQNRNRIRVGDDTCWLTVPVSFNFGDTLVQTRIGNVPKWRKKLLRTIELNYAKCPYLNVFLPELTDVLSGEYANLSEINIATVRWLMRCFEIDTPLRIASEMTSFSDDPTKRLVDICRHLNADTYLSGAGGRDYLDIPQFAEAGVKLEFQDFRHPVYPQHNARANQSFIPYLSAVDALFNCGGGARVRQNVIETCSAESGW